MLKKEKQLPKVVEIALIKQYASHILCLKGCL